MSAFAFTLIAIFLVQVFYWIIFYWGIKKGNSTQSNMQLPVSVIVCAHDEEENLKKLIPILLAQQYPEFEVIIVNDCSNDGTFDLLRVESQRHPQLKVVNVNQRPSHVNGKKYGLTLGIKAAKYEWILLTDADCLPSTTQWINEIASAFSETAGFVVAYSPYTREPGLLNTFIRFETIITGIQFLSFANLGAPYMATGRNLAYRKKIFLENKGFNGHLHITGGDDDLFVNQYATGSNTTTVLSVNSLVCSQPKKSWSDYFQQKIRHLAVGKRYKWKTRIMLAPFLLSWLFIFPLMILDLFNWNWQVVSGVILLRWMAIFLAINAFTKKSGEEFETWKIPLLDFIFWFYYLVAGISALITKRIRWKT